MSLQNLGDDKTLLLVLSLWCGPCQSLIDDLDALRASAPELRIRPVVSDRVADELRTRSDAVQADALLDPYGNLMGILASGTPTALLVDAAYLPGDVLKNLLAAVLAVSVHRAFPRLLAGRRRNA